jgi:peptidoglycan/LPS O-acetylase OafA/YrhL
MRTESIMTDARDIAVDLTWIDMLKGIAIITVFLGNWTRYYKVHFAGFGPWVQVFFILSGFGLALSYFSGKANWSWKRWVWRRITRIVIPYAIAVTFTFMLGMLGTHVYSSVDKQFSWTSLLAYLTFTRNFFPTTWDWNPPLWFMPVIIGLYISFPILIKILEKWGPWVLLLISVFVTYGTITIAVLIGAPSSHGADLFSYWMIQFSLGIVLAYVRDSRPQRLRDLVSFKAFLLGVGLFAFSWGMRTYLPLGRVYNDTFTSMGVFLILLNLSWMSRLQIPATGKVLGILTGESYLMYLLHHPTMDFLIGPLLRLPANVIIVTAFGGIYVVVLFFLCYFISQPIDKLTSWAYHKYRFN